jgi:uncharacterized protein DUF1592/uncharacterized protein DUF1588/uncharacterized protein DUF1595/uncharacterized protein DUF1585/uncharacterized protein DUF1587
MTLSRTELFNARGRAVGALALSLALSACHSNLTAPDSGTGGMTGVGGSVGGTGASGAGSAGSSGSSSGAAGAGSGSGGTTPDPGVDCDARPIDPGPSPMRLLSRREYTNTLRDLVGDVAGLDAALGPSVEASAFGLIQPDVTQVELESFQDAADVVAAAVVGNQQRLAALAPCEADAEPLACARRFVETFGARAYRAPLSDAADVERHLVLFNAGLTTSYAHGIELLLRGMLQSPRFLYRVEVGTGEVVSASAVKLSPYEVAARLSYTVWGTLPDAALSEAARAGTLSTREGVRAELERLLADPRGATLVRRFLESFVHLSDLDKVVKEEAAYPEWQDPALRQAMRGQAQRFFEHVLQTEGGRLSALFTSPTVFVNGALGGFYGVTGTDTFQPLVRSDGTASGLLTLPALLALQAKPAESSPIYRGRFVREALFCQALPAPPPDVPAPPDVEPGVSTRERLRQHEVDPTCSGCHTLLDPIGLGFEHFDAIGRYRALDGGKPVDASGELFETRDVNGPFDGVVELGQKLAASAEVEECIARQWFRYALARFEQQADVCSMQRLLETFQTSGQDLNVLPRAVAETDAFSYRRPLD